MKHLVLILILSLSPSLWAAEDFSTDAWSPGFRLLAGGGVNSSLYSSQTERIEGGMGLSFKTDFVYFIEENWAIDAGSAVKFNRIDGYLLWDTQLTLGVRRSLQTFHFGPIQAPYVRAFLGRSPTVVFTGGNDAPTRSHESDVSRMQFDGSVYGVTLGNMTKSKKGTVWFTELSFSYQTIERASEVKMEGEVPVVVYEGAADPSAQMYTVTFSIGAFVF